MGATLIENQEYKELILKEKELEEANKAVKEKENKIDNLIDEKEMIEKALQELLLVIVDNKKTFYEKIQNYDIKEEKLVKYLNKHYCKEGKLIFKKLETEENIEELDKED